MPKSLRFVVTDCLGGKTLAEEKWYFDTLHTVQRWRVSNNGWRGVGTTWEEISEVEVKMSIDSSGWDAPFSLTQFLRRASVSSLENNKPILTLSDIRGI